LHEEFEADPVGCLKACTQGDQVRKQLVRKHIKEEAIGKGECPERNHEDRAKLIDCEGTSRMCVGNEICADTMDLVIAYECSGSVTQLGCWMMSSFVVTLLEKMPGGVFGFPALKIGMVKFGNGMSLPLSDGSGFYVKDAEVLSPLSDQHDAQAAQLFQDSLKLMSVGQNFDSIGQENRGSDYWHLGYNNLAQALQKAAEVLDATDRSEGQETVAIQKVLVLTKGKRAGCTSAKEVSKTMKEKGIFIDILLFASDYDTNPKAYEILQEVASFPWEEHVHVIPGLHTLSNQASRQDAAAKLIPSICPGAISPSEAMQSMC
jgi:hypothetical protein